MLYTPVDARESRCEIADPRCFYRLPITQRRGNTRQGGAERLVSSPSFFLTRCLPKSLFLFCALYCARAGTPPATPESNLSRRVTVLPRIRAPHHPPTHAGKRRSPRHPARVSHSARSCLKPCPSECRRCRRWPCPDFQSCSPKPPRREAQPTCDAPSTRQSARDPRRSPAQHLSGRFEPQESCVPSIAPFRPDEA